MSALHECAGLVFSIATAFLWATFTALAVKDQLPTGRTAVLAAIAIVLAGLGLCLWIAEGVVRVVEAAT
jgi:hypothetical protein